MLSKEVLGLCRNASINYHDSLLPKYAGTYATTWALMNREKVHGITWHIMTPQVDAGEILKQVSIPIDTNETAFTLNAKCYQGALAAFEELVDELASGRVSRGQQDQKDHLSILTPSGRVLRASSIGTNPPRSWMVLFAL